VENVGSRFSNFVASFSAMTLLLGSHDP